MELEATPIIFGEFCVDEITTDFYDAIKICDVAIFDISYANGYVMYGLGFAHAIQKPVIQICRDDIPLPFNLKSIRTTIYDNKEISSLKSQLISSVQSALTKPKDWIWSYNNEQKSEENHIFISYSHKDKEFLDRLLIHLKPLEKIGKIEPWADTKLDAGDRWKTVIKKSLHKAKAAILLVSADFLASDFIIENELPPLLKNAKAEGTRIIPIIIKPCRFTRDKSLSRFHAINDPKTPLTTLKEPEQEGIYDKVSELIESSMVK